MKLTSINIISTKGNIYTVSGLNNPLSDPYCDCPAFRYSKKGTCDHIKIALDKLKELNE
jgi:hypothetical protein